MKGWLAEGSIAWKVIFFICLILFVVALYFAAAFAAAHGELIAFLVGVAISLLAVMLWDIRTCKRNDAMLRSILGCRRPGYSACKEDCLPIDRETGKWPTKRCSTCGLFFERRYRIWGFPFWHVHSRVDEVAERQR
jgi:hypothetical protein